MATKKEKRAAALARREQFLEEHRLSGLEAQRRDRETRVAFDAKLKEASAKINETHADRNKKGRNKRDVHKPARVS